MNNQEAYQRAQKRVEAKVGFYRHLTIYIAVCIFWTFDKEFDISRFAK